MTRTIVLALTAATLLASCGKTRTDTPARTAALSPSQVETRLAAADLADGTQDKIVAKCASCRLGMDGDPENVSRYAGYELHFCSADCKKQFDADPGAAISKLPDNVTSSRS